MGFEARGVPSGRPASYWCLLGGAKALHEVRSRATGRPASWTVRVLGGPCSATPGSSSQVSGGQGNRRFAYLWLGSLVERMLFWIQTLGFQARVGH